MLAPFERWGPESSFEMMNWGAVALGRAQVECPDAPRGGIPPAPGEVRAARELSLFPHRRTPFLRTVLIASVLEYVDNELDPRKTKWLLPDSRYRDVRCDWHLSIPTFSIHHPCGRNREWAI